MGAAKTQQEKNINPASRANLSLAFELEPPNQCRVILDVHDLRVPEMYFITEKQLLEAVVESLARNIASYRDHCVLELRGGGSESDRLNLDEHFNRQLKKALEALSSPSQ